MISPRHVLPVFLVLATPALAEPVRYEIDPSHTHIVWQADHLGFSRTIGIFDDIQGFFLLDEADPGNGRVEVTVKLASLHTGSEALDNKLRSMDFFEVEQYPFAVFKSDHIEVTAEKTAKIYGDLTMDGHTKPLTLVARLNKIGNNRITRKKTAGFSATGTLLRSQWGVSYGLPVMGDDVPLMIEVEGSPAQPGAKE